MPFLRISWVPLRLLALAAMASLWAGCGGGQGESAASGPTLLVTERDFKISAPRTIEAGNVTFRVRNLGPVAHELLVARVGREGLQFRGDGLTIDEESLHRREIGALEPGPTGQVRSMTLELTRGRYILFCNMSGHFLGGMRSVLVVT
jgi:hypothetical protein